MYLTTELFLKEHTVPDVSLRVSALHYLYEPTFRTSSTTMLWWEIQFLRKQ